MSFWFVVLVSLIAIPMVLLATGMGMIFAAAGYAGGPQESRARWVVGGWLVFAWVLASAFGAFGLAPAWRSGQGGAENFVGGLPSFIHWLAGVAIAGALAALAYRANMAARQKGAQGSPLLALLRLALLSVGMALWGAIAGWIVWPLVLWPVHRAFAWPDAATGWLHTGEVTAILVAAMLAEDAVRRWRKGRGRSGA